MEVADALYGVTMRAGVTEVISQRLSRDDEDAAA
jgi:chromosome segregation protein